MQERDLLVALEVLEVGVGVTKYLLVVVFLMTVSCTVDLTDDTVGAASTCAPSGEQVSEFHDNVYTVAIYSGSSPQCFDCHSETTPTGSFVVPVKDPSTFSENEKEDNYCYHYNFPAPSIKAKLNSDIHSGINQGIKDTVSDWVDTLE